MIRTLQLADPKATTARDVGLDDERYPLQDYEYPPSVGDSDFQYVLQQYVDGEWKFVDFLTPFHVQRDADGMTDQDYKELYGSPWDDRED